MDKYEFNIKLEQIKKLKERRDYETCAKIADGIEWRKVKQWSVLRLVAECYELAGKYEDARDLRILGYNKNMGGRNNVYKIAELYVKTGDFDDAMELYEEYKENWPTDVDHYILLYTIKYAKDAPYAELIEILEAYLKEEINEKIMYELCELYEKTGQIEKCIKECDELFLWFGEGVFVDAALEMKKAHAELSPRQQEAYDTLQLSLEKSADNIYDEDLEDDGRNNFFDFDITGIKEEEKEKIHAKEIVQEIAASSKSEVNEDEEINLDVQSEEMQESMQTSEESTQSEELPRQLEDISSEDISKMLKNMQSIGLQEPQESMQNINAQNINMQTSEENTQSEEQPRQLEDITSEEKETPNTAYKRDVALEERFTTRLDTSVYIDINAVCGATKKLPNLKRVTEEDNIQQETIKPQSTNDFDGIMNEEDEIELIKTLARNLDNFQESSEDVVTTTNEQPTANYEPNYEQNYENDEVDESAYEGLKQFMDNEELASQIIDLFEKINEELAKGEGLKNMNLIISGNGSVNRQELVLALVKSIFESKGFMTRKIARITGDALNKKGIMKVKDKLVGTILIIESAGTASMSRIDELLSVMDELSTPPFVVLEDSGDKIDILLRRNPGVEKKFGGRIELMEYSVNDMVSMAKSYAHQKGYGINDKALLQLYLILDNMHSKSGGIDTSQVESIIDKAIANSDKKGVNKVRKKLPMLSSKGVIMLTEGDFK